MWIKVEDSKTPITGVTLTWTIDRSVDANGDPTASYNTITLVSSGSSFSGYTTNSVIQVALYDNDIDYVNNIVEECVYLKVKTATSATQIVCEIYWPKTTSVKLWSSYEGRKKTDNTLAEYIDEMLLYLEEILGQSPGALPADYQVLDTDYKVFKLNKGIYHAWFPINSSNILTVINGKNFSDLSDNDMYFTSCCSYVYTDHSGDAPGPYGTGESTKGHLGPYWNIADDVCKLLMMCDSDCGTYGMDTSEIARTITPKGGGGTGPGVDGKSDISSEFVPATRKPHKYTIDDTKTYK